MTTALGFSGGQGLVCSVTTNPIEGSEREIDAWSQQPTPTGMDSQGQDSPSAALSGKREIGRSPCAHE